VTFYVAYVIACANNNTVNFATVTNDIILQRIHIFVLRYSSTRR